MSTWANVNLPIAGCLVMQEYAFYQDTVPVCLCDAWVVAQQHWPDNLLRNSTSGGNARLVAGKANKKTQNFTPARLRNSPLSDVRLYVSPRR